MLDKQGYTRARAFTRPRAHATRAHTQICNAYYFSTATIIRERASMLGYTYTDCLVLLSSAG
jgi:hypothetical protein